MPSGNISYIAMWLVWAGMAFMIRDYLSLAQRWRVEEAFICIYTYSFLISIVDR